MHLNDIVKIVTGNNAWIKIDSAKCIGHVSSFCTQRVQLVCVRVCVLSKWHCAMHRQPYFPLHILNRSAPKLTWPGLAWPVPSRLSVLLSPRSMCNCCSSNSPSCPKCLPFGAPCHKIHVPIFRIHITRTNVTVLYIGKTATIHLTLSI